MLDAFLLFFIEVSRKLTGEVFCNNLSPLVCGDGGKFAIFLGGKILDANIDLFLFKCLDSLLSFKPIENALFSFINGVFREILHLGALVLGLFDKSLDFHLVHLRVVLYYHGGHVGLEFLNLSVLKNDQNVSEHSALVLRIAHKALTAVQIFQVDFVRKVACQIVVSFLFGDSSELVLKILNLILLLA